MRWHAHGHPITEPERVRAAACVQSRCWWQAGSDTEGCCTWRASGRRVRHRATLAPAVELRVPVGLYGLAGCGAARMSAHFSAACRVFAMGCSCVTPGLPRVRGGLRWRRRRRQCTLRARARTNLLRSCTRALAQGPSPECDARRGVDCGGPSGGAQRRGAMHAPDRCGGCEACVRICYGSQAAAAQAGPSPSRGQRVLWGPLMWCGAVSANM